jgi:hypothetical protein
MPKIVVLETFSIKKCGEGSLLNKKRYPRNLLVENMWRRQTERCPGTYSKEKCFLERLLENEKMSGGLLNEEM